MCDGEAMVEDRMPQGRGSGLEGARDKSPEG